MSWVYVSESTLTKYELPTDQVSIRSAARKYPTGFRCVPDGGLEIDIGRLIVAQHLEHASPVADCLLCPKPQLPTRRRWWHRLIGRTGPC